MFLKFLQIYKYSAFFKVERLHSFAGFGLWVGIAGLANVCNERGQLNFKIFA
jgi:hypothetical protein